MKKINYIIPLLFLVIILSSCNSNVKNKNSEQTGSFVPKPQMIKEQEVKTLEIGTKAPTFTLPDINGKMVSLSNFSDAKVLVVVFTCVHCPTAQAYEDRLIKFTNDYKDKNVEVVAIMPNSNLGLSPEELGYTEYDDSYESIQLRVIDKNINFPFLYDGDSHSVSIKYGPTTTPYVFVFDQERKLRYAGNIDQNEKPGTGNGENLRAATDAILAGNSIKSTVTKSFGCSIKWAWKSESATKMDKNWQEKQVELHDIDVAGIQNLMKNNSEKLRLINIWATWCGPCIVEYPELIELQRMYGRRDFEFISISVDKTENRKNIIKFLEESYSSIQNYAYTEGDNYKLIESVDPEWNGAIPYTLLIEPDGKIVWRYQGAVNIPILKKAIVDHPMIGRYF